MAKPIMGMISLGCPKNLVDSEVMLGYLREAGFSISSKAEECEIIVVNTCAFIDKAKEEAIETILQMAYLKKRRRLKKLIVAGCLAERYGDEVLKLMPEVDALLGVNQLPQIANYCDLDGDSVPQFKPDKSRYLYDHQTPRMLTSPFYTAYIKIAEGCSHRCSYCAVPFIRGPYRSRTISSVIKEAENLAAQGVKEVNLIAQDTTSFNLDRGQKEGLSKLLRALANIEGLRWIRVLYCHPDHITFPLLETIAAEDKICPYLDIPLQHIDAKLLRMMGRRGNRSSFTHLIKTIRNIIADITLRTTFMVGFPGEGEEEFSQLLDFVEEIEFDRLGVFTFSPEKGTKAFKMGDPIAASLKEERYKRLMEMQGKIALKKNRSLIGQRQEVLVEGSCQESLHLLQGRLASQAPEVDGRVVINQGWSQPGDFSPFIITEAYEYDLIGRLAAE